MHPLPVFWFNITISLYSCFKVRDQVPYAHQRQGKIMVAQTLVFIFLCSKWENKRFWTKWQQTFHTH